jgi:hypothetical protein
MKSIKDPAETRRIEGYKILRGDKCETAFVNSKEINPEEEDDTRQPRPDEPEEYWIFEKILNERKRQDKKWGKQNHHPLSWLAILTEEIGEANKEIVEYIYSNEIDKFRLQYYEIELIHSAAVIIAAINSLRRNELKEEAK